MRVVTYGDTTPDSIDVSPEAFAILDSGEHPRSTTWSVAKCPARAPWPSGGIAGQMPNGQGNFE